MRVGEWFVREKKILSLVCIELNFIRFPSFENLFEILQESLWRNFAVVTQFAGW